MLSMTLQGADLECYQYIGSMDLISGEFPMLSATRAWAEAVDMMLHSMWRGLGAFMLYGGTTASFR